MSLGRGGTAWSADGFSVRVFKWVSLFFCHSLGGGFSLGVVFSLRVREVHFLSFWRVPFFPSTCLQGVLIMERTGKEVWLVRR